MTILSEGDGGPHRKAIAQNGLRQLVIARLRWRLAPIYAKRSADGSMRPIASWSAAQRLTAERQL